MMFLFNFRSLVIKQSLWIILAVLIVAGGIFGIARSISLAYLSESLESRATETTNGAVWRMDRTFFETMRIAEMLALRIGERRYSQDELRKIMIETLITAHKNLPEVFALAIAYEPTAFDNIGQYMQLAEYNFSRVKIIDGGKYQNKSWYTTALQQNKGVWCDPFIGDFIKEPIAVYALPFYETKPDGSKIPAGVVCIDLSLSFLRQLIEEIPINDSGNAFLVSSSGQIVYHRNQDFVFKETIFSIANKIKNPTVNKIARAMLERDSGFVPCQDTQGRDVWISYRPLESNGWSVGILFPQKEIFNMVKNLEESLLYFGIFGLLLLIAVIVWVSMRTSRSLNKLTKIAVELGRGNFGVDIPKLKGKDELSIFNDTFRQMRISLISYIDKVKETTANHEQIANELKIARAIQNSTLPEIVPPFPKCSNFEINAALIPTREVGGNLHDFFTISESKICLAIGDTSTKGVGASLLTAITQALHRGLINDGKLSPKQLITSMNSTLCRHSHNGMFITYCFAILDLKSGLLTYCNAGHNPFAIIKPGVAPRFSDKPNGLPLGTLVGATYTESSISLSPGDAIFMYTDGVTEAVNNNGAFFGADRLLTILEKQSKTELTPSGINLSVLDSLNFFCSNAEQPNDTTLLSLKFIAPTTTKKQ